MRMLLLLVLLIGGARESGGAGPEPVLTRAIALPGVTGLAQVHLPGDTSLSSVRVKLAHDLFYIQQMSPALDIRILFCTGLRVLGVSYESIRRLSGMPNEQVIERAVQIVMDGRPVWALSQSA